MSKKAKRKKLFKILAGALSFAGCFYFRRNSRRFLDSHSKDSRRRFFKRPESRPIYENLRPDWQNNSLGHPQRHPKDGGALAEISRHIKNATIAIEDSSFTSIRELTCRE